MPVWQTASPSTRVTNAEAVRRPEEMTYADAQRAVNFVVFSPDWLPDDCSVTEITVRPEQPPGRPDTISTEDIGQTPHSAGNPCSLRVVVTGDERQFRLKQFLYDWAPPAASIAPLWGTPDPAPFECRDAVGWLGTDYKDQRGACVQLERTQIELSVSDGEFDDEELCSIFQGLTPTDTDTGRTVRSVPFHRLNYWVRYQCRPPGVPHGLWRHAPQRPYDRSRVLSPAGLETDLPVAPLVPTTDRYLFDSAVLFPHSNAIECVYRNRENCSDHLWITAATAESPLAPSPPLDTADQPAETRRRIELRETDAHYAALTAEYGAWEALWVEDDVHYAVFAGASRFLDETAFQTVVDSLESP